MAIKQFKTRHIRPSSFGARLKLRRQRRQLTLTQIEEQSKVHIKYLQALEQDQYQNLPAEVYSLGFARRYLETLDLPEKKIQELIKEFQSQFKIWKKQHQGQLAVTTLKERRPIITPKILLSLVSGLTLLLIASYIWLQIRTLTSPPQLTIISPEGETVVEKDIVEIIGQVNQDATIVINNQTINTQKDGSFSEKIKLAEGINNIEIKAENRFKKQTIKNLQILKSRGEGNTRI